MHGHHRPRDGSWAYKEGDSLRWIPPNDGIESKFPEKNEYLLVTTCCRLSG